MNILFLVNDYFPQGTAFSARAIAFCKLLTFNGHHVHVISARTKNPKFAPCMQHQLDYCTFETVSDKPESSIETYYPNYKYLNYVRKAIHRLHPDAVFSNSCIWEFKHIRKYCSQFGIPFFIEQCEWRDASNFRFGKHDPRYLAETGCINGHFLKADGVIAISRLFENHYRNHHVAVVRIPTILDVQNMAYRLKNINQKIVLVYTGSPGVSKEYLKPVIQALSENTYLRERVEFHIYGPSKSAVLTNINNDEEMLRKAGTSVVIHGRVAQSEISAILKNADYQIFLRPDRRSSNAGFPTKLGESMAVGTPVITNNTGDIGLYLKNGENGFVLERPDAANVQKVLEKVVCVHKEAYELLRQHARETAEKCFDYRAYSDIIKQLIY